MKRIFTWRALLPAAAVLAIAAALVFTAFQWGPEGQYGPTDPRLSAMQVLDATEWQDEPKLQSQWRRLVIPVAYGEQQLSILLQTYAHHDTTVYVHQPGNQLKEFAIPASHQLVFSHTLGYEPNSAAPVTVFYYGAAASRIWVDSDPISPLWRGMLIGAGLMLVALNLVLAIAIPRPLGLGLALLGPILLLLPLLSPLLAWLALFTGTLLHLPARSHRWLVWLLPLGILPLALPNDWLAVLPVVLCPPLLALMLKPGPSLVPWAYRLQLLCLVTLCLERIPVPTLQPLWLMTLILCFLLSHQLEQLCWLLTRWERRDQDATATKPANTRQQQQRRLGDLQGQIDTLERQNRVLEEKSTTDPLTGLRNRQFFNERYRVEIACSARESRPLSLLIIDLDHFKSINDTHGHPVGDYVLQQVAKRTYFTLRRPADTLCRYGGEEFVILLPDTGENGAVHVAEALLEQIRKEPITCGEISLTVTASIGVATVYQRPDMMDMELLRQADLALYRAKDGGRNQYCLAGRVGAPASPGSVALSG